MKRPSFQFYPGDWQRDAALRSCSVGARGLWIDMLCLMHEGTPYGHLKVKAKAISNENLARIVGATHQETVGWLSELEDSGVFSRDENGCIFSRRMVRDEELRVIRAAGGKEGGNPKLVGEYNEPGYLYVAERSSDLALKIGISKTPSKRLYKIRAQYPNDDVTLVTSVMVPDMGATEKSVHMEFAAKRSGEWFSLSSSEREQLLSLVDHLKVNGKAITTPASSSSSSSAKETSSAASEKISLSAAGQWEGVTEDRKALWATAYPAVQLDPELASAAAWAVANPQNRKSNWGRFLTNWLKRAQDRAPAKGGGKATAAQTQIFCEYRGDPWSPATPECGMPNVRKGAIYGGRALCEHHERELTERHDRKTEMPDHVRKTLNEFVRKATA